jgi:hypothetical protein
VSDEESQLRGLALELSTFPPGAPLVTATLTYCDRTTGPAGGLVHPEDRLAEVQDRYGPEHVVSGALRQAWPRLAAQLRLVEEQLLTTGR